METFSALLALCAGNSLVNGEFPSQRPVTRSFKVLFDLCLNKRLSKQSSGWWFEAPSGSLWRHCNAKPTRWPSLVKKSFANIIPISQIPISHKTPFRTEMCTFLFWMVHCGIWDRCMMGFVNLVYLTYVFKYRPNVLLWTWMSRGLLLILTYVSNTFLMDSLLTFFIMYFFRIHLNWFSYSFITILMRYYCEKNSKWYDSRICMLWL